MTAEFWSGQQDSNLQQPIETNQGDSDKLPSGGVAPDQRQGAILTGSKPPRFDLSGTIRRISYGFAVLPRWTYDVGWLWWNSYQTLVIEHPRGDGKAFMAFEPDGEQP